MPLVRSSLALGGVWFALFAFAGFSFTERSLARTMTRKAAAVPSYPASIGAAVRDDDTARSAEARVFASAEECEAVIESGKRSARLPGRARLASWNLHWFPDGKPGRASRQSGVNIEWLACALAFLDADVIAVQEIKLSDSAKLVLDALLSRLARATQSKFAAAFDDCGNAAPQHVGFIWNEARAVATRLRTEGELNPNGERCGGQLRPGLGASFRFRGGLDVRLVSVHFKSMADTRAFELRLDSFLRARELYRGYAAREKDDDFALLGDFNTMGCDECSPLVSGASELELAAQVVGNAGLRFLPADATGSAFHRGRPSLLDHVIAARSMRELGDDARVHVSGACAPAVPAGAGGHRTRRRFTELSDHCPLVVDLRDQDLDP